MKNLKDQSLIILKEKIRRANLKLEIAREKLLKFSDDY